MSSVLFVCTANRFRSILSEAIFRQMLNKANLNAKWVVNSAGTWTSDGYSATKEAIEIADKMGLDISNHRSRVITHNIICKPNVIVVMEQGHKEALINEFPDVSGRVFMLSEISNGVTYNIPDPYETDETPDEVAGEINQLLILGFNRILQLGR